MPDKNWKSWEIDELLARVRADLRKKKKFEEDLKRHVYQDVLLIPIRYPPGSNFPVGPGMH